MKYDGPERRYIYRHHVTGVSVYYTPPRGWWPSRRAPSRRCEVRDINWRGLRFNASSRLSKGAVLELTFECFADMSLTGPDSAVRAQVMWRKWNPNRNAWRTGVQFLDCPQVMRDRILAMIDRAAARDKDMKVAADGML